MEKEYRYHPERPRLFSTFIIISIILNAIFILQNLNFISALSLIILCTQLYGLFRLWKLEEIGFYFWFVPQLLILIQMARAPNPLPFIIEAVITVLFFYCIGPAWNSLD